MVEFRDSSRLLVVDSVPQPSPIEGDPRQKFLVSYEIGARSLANLTETYTYVQD